ncbi:MAG: class I SAM-dependent methyltransferase [bacterium]
MTAWDIKARFYNSARSLPILKQFYQAEIRNLQRLLPARSFGIHLDIGTGTGASLAVFPTSKLKVISDCSQKMLAEAKKAFRSPAIQLDANHKLPFQSHTFDLVSAIGVLEYLHDADIFFSETHRVAKKGAAFVLTSTPPGLFAKLRAVTGSPPRQRSGESIRSSLHRCGWNVKKQDRSLMQNQWFCRKD